MTKIIIISGSGMGCGIMFAPTLKALRKKFPQGHITFLGLNKAFVAPFHGSELVDNTVVFDFAKDSLWQLSKLKSRLNQLRQLCRKKFDYSFCVFPSNKWHFNVFAWLVGARRRITHRYQTSSLANMSWLQNRRIPADPRLHDVDQNMNLLTAIGVDPKKITDKKLFFYVSDEERVAAEKFIKKQELENKKFIGFHVGSSRDFDSSAKRWPTAKFAALADRIQDELGAPVLVFAGPDETAEVAKMAAQMRTQPLVVPARLGKTAAIIERCQVMVSNDSGLMHIAVAMDTPVVALFGPTIITRTRPYTDKSTVIFNPKCHSLLKYPFATTSARINTKQAANCFPAISVDQVFAAVKKYFNGSL